MNKKSFQSLPKGYLVNESYTILLYIKKGINAETYRAKGIDGKLYFVKIFDYSKLNRSAFDKNNNILEIELVKNLNHPNLVSYVEHGDLIFENRKFGFLVQDYIVGETLAEKITREPFNLLLDIRGVISGVLDGLYYLHNLQEPIIHNEITPQNIMLDLSHSTPVARIIDFGYARPFHQSSKSFNKEGLNLNYLATECFNNIYSPQSDIFSVGAVLHQLIYGMPPWFKDVSQFISERNKSEDIVTKQRDNQLNLLESPESIIDFDITINNIILKALDKDLDIRFENALQFKKALNGEIDIDNIGNQKKVNSAKSEKTKISFQKAQGKGFDAIAGMQELKDQLRLDVIDALHKPDEYATYGITIPNGMLLYGPPGCGKTFFAKHFAEEVGFNFMLATPSTLKSRYVNATQENIAEMFIEAEKNAPTIIFIDEINELLPNRDSNSHEMSKSAVNEMLAQMDRTGEKGIFIVGATNYPDMIDPAMLRSGRLDKKFYLPPPDFSARKAMFEMYLRNRPLDFGIDYDVLAKKTENYVSSDIELIVNEASRSALKVKSRITMNTLIDVIAKTKPSVPKSELDKYEKIKARMNSELPESTNERPRIGFKTH
jgi:transitional endoplasmic reticulum ATPase